MKYKNKLHSFPLTTPPFIESAAVNVVNNLAHLITQRFTLIQLAEPWSALNTVQIQATHIFLTTEFVTYNYNPFIKSAAVSKADSTASQLYRIN